MSEAIIIAILSFLGLLLPAIGVEMMRGRKQTQAVLSTITPNGGSSLRDAVDRIERQVNELRTEMSRDGQRIAAVEAILSDRGRDGR
jgi:hypothetical protein